jgi:outer membrane murein-binding lipoprotein Lpp
MSRATTFALILGVAALAGTGVYVPQQRQLQRVRAEYRTLAARQAGLMAERDGATQAAQAARSEVEGLQVDRAELKRLREETTQLRRERDALRLRVPQPTPPVAAGKPLAKPEGYILREQLAFAGYATPEAALESTTWAMMKGTYDQALAGLESEEMKREVQDSVSREQFETQRDTLAAALKGMQIVARKTLDGDRVELKFKMDSDPLPNNQGDQPPLVIQPMLKVGDDWKLGGSTRPFEPEWDNDGQIQSLAQ